MLKKLFLSLVVAGVCTTGATAQSLVFDNVAGLDVNNAVASDLGAFIASANIDDVTFSADTNVTSVEWSGIYAASPIPGGDSFIADDNVNFTISIFNSDGNGGIGAAAQRFAVGNNVTITADPDAGITTPAGAPANAFDYSTDIDFDFEAGTTYFLSIVNDNGDTADTDQFNQLVAAPVVNPPGTPQNPPTGDAFSSFEGVNFGGAAQQSFATDFQLIGTTTTAAIPEPSSAILLALGFAGFVARRRR